MQRTRFILPLFAAVALFVALPLAISAQTSSVSGLWTLTWETPRGEQTFQVTLEQSETSFSGSAEGRMGEMPVKDGTIEGDKVRFVIEMTMGRPGGDQTRTIEQVFEGVLADGVIKGEIQTPAMGGRGGGGQGGPGGPRAFTMTRGEG